MFEVTHIKEKKLKKKLEHYKLLTYNVNRAIEIVEHYFKNIKRDDGSSYIEQHIYPITWDVIKLYGRHTSEEIIISALFHDLFEDTSFSKS